MGRLFAVIHIDGQQRKVTTEDLLVVGGIFPPQIGDKIRLEKVSPHSPGIMSLNPSSANDSFR